MAVKVRPPSLKGILFHKIPEGGRPERAKISCFLFDSEQMAVRPFVQNISGVPPDALWDFAKRNPYLTREGVFFFRFLSDQKAEQKIGRDGDTDLIVIPNLV